MTIGIKELAETLGISIGTVSRAINNKPDVSPKTRALVQEAAKNLGYVASQSGPSLRKGSTQTIGLILNLHGDKMDQRLDGSILQLAAEIQKALTPAGFDLILLPCSEDETPHDFLLRILGRRITDGFITLGFDLDDDQIRTLQSTRIPFISLGLSCMPNLGDRIGHQILSEISAKVSASKQEIGNES